jgi:hypothetical protein
MKVGDADFAGVEAVAGETGWWVAGKRLLCDEGQRLIIGNGVQP